MLGGRGAGVGTALIEDVRTWAAQHGPSKVYRLTDQNNQIARSVYDKLSQRSGMIQYQIGLEQRGGCTPQARRRPSLAPMRQTYDHPS